MKTRGLITSFIDVFKDPLVIGIIVMAVCACIVPVRGEAAQKFTILTNCAVALLFFLYGARLSPREAFEGLKHWKLHSTILAFTYIAFPLIGLALKPLEFVIGHDLYMGLLYLSLVPSTVQSSVAFTSIAMGNVAGAIVSASASNLIGVIATPVLVMIFMSGPSLHISTDVFVDVAVQLLLPFVLGQVARLWKPVITVAKSKATKNVDRISIYLVVYSAFSAGIVMGVWHSVSWWQILAVVVIAFIWVEFMLALTWWVGRKLGFEYGDLVATQFCGSKKSLASGLPMSLVIFPHTAAILVVPLMIFHQIQLMVCSIRASRYAREKA